MRQRIKISDDWWFQKDPGNGDKEAPWKKVTIPHTWNGIDGANGFDYAKGVYCYHKEIRLETEDLLKKIYLEFEGVNSIADVSVNGHFVGQHRGGFSAFRFEVSNYLVANQGNLIEVKVDNRVAEDVYPQMADFTFFGGIYRDVWLVLVDELHVDLMDMGSSGVYLTQKEVSQEIAHVEVKTRVVNQSKWSQSFRLWVEARNANGEVVAYQGKDLELVSDGLEEILLPLQIIEPILWNGKENPYQYQFRIQVQAYNEVIDEVEIKTGLRFFEVDPEKGFLLNGEAMRLNGVSRHQDRMGKGWAISYEDMEEDMALIHEIGANSIRLAHYQHHAYFYDLCDREGMVIWAEIPFISVMSKTELEGSNAKSQMIELIRQNYNHPSVFFWGIQNEIQIGGERPEVRRLVRELNEITKKEDPTRLTTLANVMFVGEEDEYNTITDIVGYNKYYGWYQGKAEDFAPWLDYFHKVNPKIALGISEYGAEGILKYHSETPEVKDYTEEYHALYHETVWKIFEKRNWLWSTYVWNMFDFGANIRDEGGVKGRNNKGLVTYDRKIKKDAFYMYKAHWSKEKFVHITSKRFLERTRHLIQVKVYSNCEEVRLYVNGELAGSKDGDKKIFVFENIHLKKGQNRIQAVVGKAQELSDTAYFTLVEEENPSYKAPEAKGGVVSNWFSMPEDVKELSSSQDKVESLVIPEGVYSTKDSLDTLMKQVETKKILIKYLGDFEQHPMYGMLSGMTFDLLADMEPKTFNLSFINRLNRELIQIKK